MSLNACYKSLSLIAFRVALASLLILGIGVPHARAQAPSLQFKHITVDDGLLQSTVTRIYRDRKGFAWIASPSGISRFDGYSFQYYQNEPGDPTSLPAGQVNALYEDSRGVLWIGSSGGLSRYDRATDTFVNAVRGALVGPEYQGGDTDVSVNGIVEDRDGRFWIGTSAGLALFDREKGRAVRHFAHSDENPASLSNDVVQAVYIDSRGSFWIGTTGGGLDRFDPQQGAFAHFVHDDRDPKSLVSNTVTTVAEDRRGNLWIGLDQGLCRTPLAAPGSFICYRNDPANGTSLGVNSVREVEIDGQGRVWIGTENGGLNLYDPETDGFIRYMVEPSNPNGLNSNSIWDFYFDQTGAMWVGTFSGGVNLTKKNSDAILLYQNVAGSRSSLSYNNIAGFLEDSRGNFWVATDGGGLNRMDRETGQFVHFSRTNSNLNSDAILALQEDGQGNLWMGTWAGGINMLAPGSTTFVSYTARNSGIPVDHVFSLHIDRRDRLWVGTFGGGLARFDLSTRKFTAVYSTENSDITGDEIEAIIEDAQGRLVVGANGLNFFDPESETFTTFRHDEADSTSLSSNAVSSLALADDGTLWIGTARGLNRFDRRTNSFVHYFEEDGLPSDDVKGVVIDGRGAVWVSTARGLSRFDPKTATFKNYTRADGLQGSEFNPRSFYRDGQGNLFFGGNNGFNLIRPDRIVENRTPPAVVLTDFQLFNKPVAIGAKGSPLTQQISETEEIVLTHSQNVLSFTFAALDFTAPEKNQYAYMLEGFDEDWNYVGSQRTASYTNLNPGTYVFRVKASNNDGVWNEEGVSVRVIVKPAFWATWWFRLLVLLAIGAAVREVVRRARMRRKNLEMMNARLQTEIAHSKEAEEEKERVAAEAARKDEVARQALQEHQQYLEESVIRILSEMERFSEGDLTVALEERSEDAIGRLYRGFNRVVSNFRRIIEQVNRSVEATAASGQQISESTEILARGAQEQSRQSVEVAGAVEELTWTIGDNAQHISLAASMAKKSEQEAHQGGMVVKDTIHAMSHIAEVVNRSAQTVDALGQGSQQIGDIAHLIGEITDQTNLLALNAAIEAARAGDAGRGFAVVADEVRKLAERTAKAAEEIAERIRRVQAETKEAVRSMQQATSEVEQGRQLVDKAGLALDSIITNSQKVLDSITQIASASQQQTETSQHISKTIVVISDVTTAAAVQNKEIARAAEALARLMGQLQTTVDQFNLGVAAPAGDGSASPAVPAFRSSGYPARG